MVGRGIENGVLKVAPKYPQEYLVFVSLGLAELRNSNVHFFNSFHCPAHRLFFKGLESYDITPVPCTGFWGLFINKALVQISIR